MALDQSALLELLGELKLTDVSDRIRVATEKLYQELIDAEAAAFIGAAPFERNPTPQDATQRHPSSDADDHRGASSSCGSRSCGRGRSSRRCWNDAAGSIRPCSRW
jgi:hypothetical protein